MQGEKKGIVTIVSCYEKIDGCEQLKRPSLYTATDGDFEWCGVSSWKLYEHLFRVATSGRPVLGAVMVRQVDVGNLSRHAVEDYPFSLSSIRLRAWRRQPINALEYLACLK